MCSSRSPASSCWSTAPRRRPTAWARSRSPTSARCRTLAEPFELLRRDPELTAEREQLAPWLAAEPDKTLAFVAEMDFDAVEGPAVYVCPMHPEVVSEEPGHCPSAA